METIEPASISAELLDPVDDGSDQAQVAPPVVVVVVTHDPGPWLEDTLRALAAQDYPALSVLVLDNGSTDDPTARIAQAMPRAFVRRRAAGAVGGLGFAAAANEALGAVEGATFLCFCHDDVTPDPDAIGVMVEEAYRSNAGIVGPKLVDAEHRDVLLEVGMAVDHYGVPFSGIEPDEVDQEQHDAVRDVFFVSHALMLVRTDLFHELGGFDAATFPGADDVDLCWRARLAGARIIVAPAARVGHRRATAAEQRTRRTTDAAALRDETRSRMRLLFKSYSAVALLWVLPVAFVLGLLESAWLAATGRARKAAALCSGLFGAFARPGELRRARRETQRLRQVDDADVRDLMIGGSARLRSFVTQRMHAEARLTEVSARTRDRLDDLGGRFRRLPAVLGALLALLLLVGSRSLLFGRVAEVGAFRVWPGAGAAWDAFTGSWRSTFLGSGHAASPFFGLMAVLDAVLLGHAGMARSLVIGGALPLGAWGTYRLVRPMADAPLPAVAAAAAYAVNPIARNAIYQGELGPLVCFALAPFVLHVMVRATARDDRAPVRRDVAIVGLLVAIAGSVWPPALLLALLFAATFLLASPFAREGGHVTRPVVVALAGTALALVLCLPWVTSLFGADAATLGALSRPALSLANVLRFHTSRAGAGIAPYGILAAAVVPLLIATGPRLAWAMRAWTLAVASFVLAWVPSRVSAGAAVPSPNGLLVGAALGIALAAGLGVAAVQDDLRRTHFGWRQTSTIVVVAGLALSSFGFALDTVSGRFALGTTDWASSYSWFRDQGSPGTFRVLWLGDGSSLPADAKPLAGSGAGASFALTRGGTGDARALLAGPESAADRTLADAIAAAASGSTARLGHLLAPAGVRYIALLSRAAPGDGHPDRPMPRLADALSRQLDVSLSRTEAAGVVYENDAWLPVHAVVPPNDTTVGFAGRDPHVAALQSSAANARGVAVRDDRTAPIGPGTLLWGEAASNDWHASADGKPAARSDAFGLTNAFDLSSNGRVHVTYRASAMQGIMRDLAVIAWFVTIGVWLTARRRRRTRARRA